jgi:sulfur relay (sulfurtransferase) DsrC/TusE family protein
MTLPSDIPEDIADRAAILMDEHRHIEDDLEYTARIIMAATAPVTGITAEHARLLKFYREFQGENGHTPSYREAADGLGVTKSRIFYLLHQLEERGVVMLPAGRARAVTILARA